MKSAKNWLVLLVLFVVLPEVSAQAENTILKRKTFEICSKFPDPEHKYYRQAKYYTEAVSRDTTMDSYRFLDQRRTIDFLNSDIYAVLYSAKEIEEKHGFPVSPSVIRQGQPYPAVVFEYDSVSRTVIVHNKE